MVSWRRSYINPRVIPMKILMNSNKSQKKILYFSALIFVVIVFIHNPTQGYWTTITKEKSEHINNIGKNCSAKIIKVNIFDESAKYQVKETCDYKYGLPFLRWYSTGAIVEWFGFIGNVFWTFIFTSIVTFLGFHAASRSEHDK